MPNVYAATVFPESRQWVGIGRETTAGTIVSPGASIPVEKPEPDEKPTFLKDTSLRGSMGGTYGVIEGTEYAEFQLGGPVYLGTIGYLIHNLMGDYQASGTSGSPNWTATGGVSAGAGPITVTSGSVAVQGTFIQIGSTAPTEIVKVGSGSTATSIVVDPTTPIRFNHVGSTTVTTVTAPFTHVFSLLNTGNGQPVTHTLTHYQGISGTYGARQYAYACVGEVDFTYSAEQLFTHTSKLTSILGQAAASSPTNTLDTSQAQPSWQFKVGIGGPASGGTLISNVTDGGVNITRNLKTYFGANGQQAPYVIARNALMMTGKFTHLAQDESPMLNMLNNVQPQLQLVMTNGLTGNNLLSIQFDVQVGAYETSKLQGNDELEYAVTWEGVLNSTNAGASGGLSPGKVTIQNAVPTY